MIDMKDMIKEIKRQSREKKKGKRQDYNFLGFVERDDLTKEVENLFATITPRGYTYYNWISGSEKMEGLTERIEMEASK